MMRARHSQTDRGVRLRLARDAAPAVPARAAITLQQREQLILTITRAIARLEARGRRLKRLQAETREALKAQRRGLRIALRDQHATALDHDSGDEDA